MTILKKLKEGKINCNLDEVIDFLSAQSEQNKITAFQYHNGTKEFSCYERSASNNVYEFNVMGNCLVFSSKQMMFSLLEKSIVKIICEDGNYFTFVTKNNSSVGIETRDRFVK